MYSPKKEAMHYNSITNKTEGIMQAVDSFRVTVVNQAGQAVDEKELPATGNALARALDGIPERPSDIPESVVKAVEVFARAMIDKRFWHGWGGDTSDAFFTDSVSNYLSMPTKEDRSTAFRALQSSLDNASNYTDVPRETLEVVAKHFGYAIQWKEDKTFANPIQQLFRIYN
jgi:hypothetical protein